jgi:hypothetical protein
MRLKQIAIFIYIFAIVCALITANSPTHAAPQVPAQQNHVAVEESVCRNILVRAIDTLQGNCATLSRNSACYGNSSVEAVFASTNPIKFDALGDKAPIQVIKTLKTSPLNVERGTWGISLLKLQANLPNTLPGQSVTFLVFGDTALQNASGNMQTFYFSSGLGYPECKDVPRDGILVRSPNHTEVTFTANGVQITIASTVMLHATKNGSMEIRLIEGRARVTTPSGTQTMQPGQVIHVPLGGSTGLDAVGAPSAPISNFIELPLSTLALRVQPFSGSDAPINLALVGCISKIEGGIARINDYSVNIASNSVLANVKVGDCVSLTAVAQLGADNALVVRPITVALTPTNINVSNGNVNVSVGGVSASAGTSGINVSVGSTSVSASSSGVNVNVGGSVSVSVGGGGGSSGGGGGINVKIGGIGIKIGGK